MKEKTPPPPPIEPGIYELPDGSKVIVLQQWAYDMLRQIAGKGK